MKLAKYVMKELKTVAINTLFLRIAVRKISYIFQEKHSCEIAFLKQNCRLPDTY